MIIKNYEFGTVGLTIRGDMVRSVFTWDDSALDWCIDAIGYQPKVVATDPLRIIFTREVDRVLFIIKYPSAKDYLRIGLISVMKDRIKKVFA